MRLILLFLILLSINARGTARADSEILTVYSWNMKHLGRKNQNTEAAAALLKDADIITFQEVDKGKSGQIALMRLATQLRKQQTDRICVALSEIPSGGLERYGFLWKDRRVGYVKANGDIMESCPSSALTVRLVTKNADRIVREPAVGAFYAKAAQKRFTLASVHLVPSGKKPQREVPFVFDALSELTGPVIVAGDYNLDSGQSSFRVARDLGFRPAFIGTKTSLKSKKRELSKAYDNFWSKSVSLQSAAVVDLYGRLPLMPQREIYNSISDHCPIRAEFGFAGQTRLPSGEAHR